MLGGVEAAVWFGVVAVVPGAVVDDALVVVGEPAVTITGEIGDAEGAEVVTPDGVTVSLA